MRTDAYGKHTSVSRGRVTSGCRAAERGYVRMSGDTGGRVGLGQPLRVPEFRALWGAELVSVAGDQLARVGLSVLVFGRTGSAVWAAATYALTFLPALVGRVLLGRLADRCPRRRVMLACDLVRAVLVALMALPLTPLPVLCALLVAVVLLAPLHTAALGALLPEVVPGAVFDAALTLRYVTGQVAQVGGFVLGGVLVAALSPSAALTLDAASFLVSALAVRLGVAERPVPGAAAPARRATWSVDAREALRTVLYDGRRRQGGGVRVRRSPSGSPGAVGHPGLLSGRWRLHPSNAPGHVSGAVGRPPSGRRPRGDDERRSSPCATMDVRSAHVRVAVRAITVRIGITTLGLDLQERS
jgi:hypothetical protein